MKKLLNWLFGIDEYQYGTCLDKSARKNLRTGVVEVYRPWLFYKRGSPDWFRVVNLSEEFKPYK